MDCVGSKWGVGSMSHGVCKQPLHGGGSSSVSGLLMLPHVGLRGNRCTKLTPELSVRNQDIPAEDTDPNGISLGVETG